MHKTLVKYSSAAFLLYTLFLFTGCDLGGGGGTLSDSVYLEKVTDGSRVYSGGIINLDTIDMADANYTVSYRLVNDLGEEVSLYRSPDLVNFVYDLISYSGGSVYYNHTESGYYSYFTLDQDTLSETIPAGGQSGVLDFNMFSQADTCQIRRRFAITLSGSSGFYDFEFEVYGYFTS